MDKMHFAITIHASRKKVWDTMLCAESYRAWTDVFMPGSGSHYVGDWNQGSKILFLATGENGLMSGMVSQIKENRLHEYISIEHLGVVHDGKEDTSGESVKQWAGAHENYTFKEIDGGTELLVDMDTNDEFKEMFQGIWPKALQKLKELAEK